jgi:hypothetical protein
MMEQELKGLLEVQAEFEEAKTSWEVKKGTFEEEAILKEERIS